VLEVTVSRMGRRCGSTSRTARPAPCGPQRLLAPRLVVVAAALRFTASTTALVGRIRVRCTARAVQCQEGAWHVTGTLEPAPQSER
jgi:hypothetical protein